VAGEAWFAAGYLLLLTVIWLRQLWQDHEYWRSRRGIARTAPSVVLFVTVGVLFVPAVAIADADNAASVVLLLTLLIALAIATLLIVTTFLFNRPKLLVPPPRRGDPSPFGVALRRGRPRS
jgi:hypothetical protein